MPSETTKLTINIDINQASLKARKLASELQKLGLAGKGSGVQVQQGMQQATQGINQAADASAAAAVRFQTMTQGMLNLTTTSIQTFTSISNLARAENRASASLVGKQRAQDALNRFQIKYNKLLEAGGASVRDLTQAQNELNTAVDDYAVKAEKAKIEADAVFDIQLLFFANILNVGVSTYQVLNTMVGAHTKALIKNTIVTKLNSISKFNNSHTLFGNTIQMKINTVSLGVQTGAFRVSTMATRLQTVALKGLKIALGPIGLIFIGISAAMVAYESNALGLKDTINGLLGIQDEMNESLDEGKQGADAFAQELLDLDEVAGKKLPDSFRKLKDEIIKLRGAMQLTSGDATMTFQKVIQANNALKDFSKAGVPSQEAIEKQKDLEDPQIRNFLSSNRLVPQLLGGLVQIANERGISIGGKKSTGIKPFQGPHKPKTLKELQDSPFFFERIVGNNPAVIEFDLVNQVLLKFGLDKEKMNLLSPIKQKKAKTLALQLGVFEDVLSSDDLQRKFAELVNIQLEADDKDIKRFIDFANITNILDPVDRLIPAALVTDKELFSLNFLPDKRSIPAFLSGLIKSGQGGLIKGIDQRKLDFVINGLTFNNLLTAQVRKAGEFTSGARVKPFDLSGLREGRKATQQQLTRLIAFSGLRSFSADSVITNKAKLFLRRLGISPTQSENGTPNIIIDAKLKQDLMRIEESGSVRRAEIFIETGIDIGRIADVISKTDAFRIGRLEGALRDGSFFRSPEGLLESGLLNQSGFQFKGITLVGTQQGKFGNIFETPDGVQFTTNGRFMEVDLDGRKITLPMGFETFNAVNKRAEEINSNIRDEIIRSSNVVQDSLFVQRKQVGFGEGFFNQFGGAINNFAGRATGLSNIFAGISETAALQLTSSPSSLGSIEHHRNKVARESFIKSGKLFEQEAIRFAIMGSRIRPRTMGRSEADSPLVKKLNKQLAVVRFFNTTILAGFGGGGSDVVGQEIRDDLFEIGFRLSESPDLRDNRIGQEMLRLADKAEELRLGLFASSSIGTIMVHKQAILREVVGPALALVGLDTQFTQKIRRRQYGKDSPFSKSFQRRHRFILTGKSPLEFLREDLGLAGFENRDIRIPAPSRALMAKALIFAQNKFSDFNDMNIAGNAIDVLVGGQGLTRQQVWDIRFNTTKGDRELFNRIRFERMEAVSTGTSAI